jgi:hypothetical protein
VLSERVTSVALTAGLFKFTEQVLLWPLLSDPFPQSTLISTGADVSVRFADCVPPFKFAVIVAVSSEEKLVTFAVN